MPPPPSLPPSLTPCNKNYILHISFPYQCKYYSHRRTKLRT
jgi:hypothetical protein